LTGITVSCIALYFFCSVREWLSFSFVSSSSQREVDDVKPGENPREDCPQDGTVPLPGAYDGNCRAKPDSCLRDGICGLIGYLSDNHKLSSE
jgi:hypothetical protein